MSMFIYMYMYDYELLYRVQQWFNSAFTDKFTYSIYRTSRLSVHLQMTTCTPCSLLWCFYMQVVFQQLCVPTINLHAKMATAYIHCISVTATMTVLTTVMKLAVVCCLLVCDRFYDICQLSCVI